MAERPNVEEVFEAWAHVAARLRKRPAPEQAAILAELGLGAEWPVVHETWSRRLNEDILAGRMDLPERYATICREEQERRRRSSVMPPRGPVQGSQPPPAQAAASPPFVGAPQFVGGSRPPPPVPPTRSRTPLPETLDVPGAPDTPPMPAGNAATMPFPSKPPSPVDLEFRLSQLAAPKSVSGDFRKDLAQPTVPPLPGQNDTASEVNLQETVAAARQVSAVVDWPLERWARLTVALERESEEHAWRDQGVTSFRAREHAQRHWNKRLSQDPKLKAEFQTIVARLRER